MNDIKALNGKLDRLLLIKQKEVHNGGYNTGFNNYKATPNLSYRSQNVAYPQHHVYPLQQQYNPYIPYPPYTLNQEFIPPQHYQGVYQQPEPQYTPHYGFAPTPQFHGGYHQQQPPAPGIDLQATLQQILQGQANCDKQEAQGYSDIMTQLDSSYNDLYSKLEDLNSRVHHLERNIDSTSSSNPLPQPRGNSFQQPKEFAKAITLRSGRQLPPRDSPVVVTEGSEDQEGEGICQDPAENMPLGQGNSAIQPELPPLDHHYPSEPVRVTSPSAEQEDKAKMKDKTSGPPPYKPPLPFPGKFKEEIKELCQAQVDKFIERITTVMPLKKAFSLLPPGNDYLKSLVLKRIEEADSLVLADGTFRLPHGLLEDVLVKVGNTIVPTVGAIIGVRKGSIEVNFDRGKGFKMKSDIKGARTKPTIEGPTFSIRGSCYLGIDTQDVDKEEDPPDPLVLSKFGEAASLHNMEKGYEEPYESHEVSEWFFNKDYPPDQEEAYLEERAIECQAGGWSRKHDEFYDLFAKEEEEIPPYGAFTMVFKEEVEYTLNEHGGKTYIADETLKERTLDTLILPTQVKVTRTRVQARNHEETVDGNLKEYHSGRPTRPCSPRHHHSVITTRPWSPSYSHSAMPHRVAQPELPLHHQPTPEGAQMSPSPTSSPNLEVVTLHSLVYTTAYL